MDIGVLGYSGHAYVVAEAALLCGHNLVGYVNKLQTEKNPFSIEYLGDETQLEFEGWKLCDAFVLGIGDNQIRERVASYFKDKNKELLTIIHPDASVSSYGKLGNGTFIARNAAVNPMCEIGDNVIINTSASIDHECKLLDGVHVAPGAVLAGNVTVGVRSFIGANSVIREGITIGNDVIIGAGTVVIKNVVDGTKLVGNPSRKL